MDKDKPVMSATKLQPTKCTFQRYIDTKCKTFLSQAVSNNGWVGKTSYFVAKCVNISKTVENTSKVTIYDQQEVAYSLSIDTKIDDLG